MKKRLLLGILSALGLVALWRLKGRIGRWGSEATEEAEEEE